MSNSNTSSEQFSEFLKSHCKVGEIDLNGKKVLGCHPFPIEVIKANDEKEFIAFEKCRLNSILGKVVEKLNTGAKAVMFCLDFPPNDYCKEDYLLAYEVTDDGATDCRSIVYNPDTGVMKEPECKQVSDISNFIASQLKEQGLRLTLKKHGVAASG